MILGAVGSPQLDVRSRTRLCGGPDPSTDAAARTRRATRVRAPPSTSRSLLRCRRPHTLRQQPTLLEPLHRHSGTRRENMAVAPAVDLDEALVVAARRDRAAAEIDRRHHRVGIARMLNADRPRCSIGMRTDNLDVAAEIDQAMPEACFRANYRGAIRSVFFDQTAEVELHPCDAEREPRSVPADLAPADAREQGFQKGRLRER